MSRNHKNPPHGTTVPTHTFPDTSVHAHNPTPRRRRTRTIETLSYQPTHAQTRTHTHTCGSVVPIQAAVHCGPPRSLAAGDADSAKWTDCVFFSHARVHGGADPIQNARRRVRVYLAPPRRDYGDGRARVDARCPLNLTQSNLFAATLDSTLNEAAIEPHVNFFQW